MQVSEALAKLNEAAVELSHFDICNTLRAELKDMFPGQWCYVQDVFGDAESGDVIYCCNGETWKAPYEIGDVNGKRTCAIDDDEAVEVMQRTVYDEEADDDDHYAGMSDTEAEEARKMTPDERRMIFTERFISKSERDSADSGSFAGKGKSFPILKPGDVMAAVHAMGRAGSANKSTEGLKASIIRIAKKKGFGKYLPKAWQGDESGNVFFNNTSGKYPDELALVESAATIETIVLKEAKSDYEIKLIAPGKGSSAFYPKEVLQRDGPKVFKAGTHVYLNHPTAAEESARPEGDVTNLAGVLTTQAVFHETHAKGPGLYARMKVFADHAQTVEEKAPHVGMSIRASGKAESGQAREGLPVLKELTSATSVDVVTHAGAGGMILTESATSQTTQEGEMTLQEAQKLIDEAVAKAQAPLLERALRGDAREEATRCLESVTLPAQAKTRIIERALEKLPLKEAGGLDVEKFRTVVVAEAKTEGEYLAQVTGSGRVFGMGSGPALKEADPKEEKRLRKEAKRRQEDAISIFESIGMPKEAAAISARGRVA
jgi:hypothetical protein